MHINLQYFADAGDQVNATTGYVNASTGVVTDFTDAKTITITILPAESTEA